MELNFEAVKALSSPTRIHILDRLLEKERTPTQLSKDIDRSKSTVASHLDTLKESGLVEKDEEEGRKRVVYRPTRKAKTIVEGREKKVRFSLVSSALTGLAGITLLGRLPQRISGQAAGYTTQSQVTAMTADAARKTTESAGTAGSSLVTPENMLLAAGVFLLSISIGTFIYGLMIRKLGSGS